jgi:plastocyanin
VARRLRWTGFAAFFLLVWLHAGSAEAQVVQDCQPTAYLDRTATGADRQLAWDFSISSDPERCMKVRVGQTVVWNVTPDFDVHPLGGAGGDSPNPITFHNNGVVTFTAVGTFGFQCLNHASMKGAIQVVAAPPPVPASSPWVVLGLTVLLLASGSILLRRHRERNAVSENRRHG